MYLYFDFFRKTLNKINKIEHEKFIMASFVLCRLDIFVIRCGWCAFHTTYHYAPAHLSSLDLDRDCMGTKNEMLLL